MTIPDLTHKGKTVLVTGGRQGLGRAMALAFAEAGADIAICDIIDDGRLDSVAGEIRTSGRHVLTTVTDIRNRTQVEGTVKKIMDEFGHIDILINNAGVTGGGMLLDLSEGDWDRVIDTSLKGTYLCSQAVSKVMIEQRSGNIINMASVGSYLKGASPYAIAKKGIVSITQGLAHLLGPYNIRVNAMAPGAIRTEMTRRIWDTPQILEAYVNETPLGRIGEPEDVAHVALFLASDASRYITGATIMVDGGILPASVPRPSALHDPGPAGGYQGAVGLNRPHQLI